MHTIQQSLSNKRYLLEVIDHYLQELTQKPPSPRVAQKIDDLTHNKEQLAQSLAQALGNEQFLFDPAQQTRLRVSRRKKKLFTFSLQNLIVLKALLSAISPTYEQHCSDKLYSYIKKRHVRQPINRFCAFLNEHKTKDGLWVYKTDLHHFYDSIPVNQTSTIWPKLETLIAHTEEREKLPTYYKELYRQAIRPVYLNLYALPSVNLVGIPYGSPFSGLTSNLYAQDIDDVMHAFPDAFYARYCDDLLIAHPDKELTKEIIFRLQDTIKRLHLTRSAHKEKYLFFSKAGHAYPGEDLFQGSNTLTYLGCVIHANGQLHSSAPKINHLLMIISNMVEHSMKTEPYPNGELIAKRLNQELLSTDNRLIQQLFLKTNDHHFLKDLDARIALILAQALSGIPGRKAFRKIPYQSIRKDFALNSLCMMRNERIS